MPGVAEVKTIFDRLNLRRRHCTKESGTVVHRSARIINILGDRKAIYIGSRTHVLGELLTFAHGGKISIGSDCYIGEGSRIWSAEKIIIEDRVLISHGVNIFDCLTHPINAAERHEHFKSITSHGHPKVISLGEKPVTIAKDAWVGALSIIQRGVNIGQGAIIGAGSVVKDDVPAWTIVGGNPAIVIRKLTDEERS